MTALDWAVLSATLAFIVIYGAWKSRRVQNAGDYFRESTLKWPTIGLGIMATQASAITFLSTPGQGFEDGMRFVQFYFGLPLAMVVISAVFVPIFYRLEVYTAYEYLERRFDVRVRYLGAILFLIQRGLSAGITIYAPSIILSALLGWPLQATNLGMGLVVIVYTVLGGTRAVSQTQKQQMVVMLAGMLLAAVLIVLRLPEHVSLRNAVKLAGALDRMNPVSFELNTKTRYTFWSGITGGFFLALSYFGTDQSQVQRYLSGRSVAESRLGLLFNGMLKVPMQFVILFTGVMVFVFYLFTQPPLFFNQPVLDRLARSEHGAELQSLQLRYDRAFAQQRSAANAFVAAQDAAEAKPEADPGAQQLRATASETRQQLRAAAGEAQQVVRETRALVKRALPDANTKDSDYVFLSFVLRFVPSGLVGLLLAAILCAAMSSTASELAALGSTTTLDLYQRMRRKPASAQHDLWASKLFTALWGLVAVSFAAFASLVDNLIEAVNLYGSIFYGAPLGLFLVAFFTPRVTAGPVLIAALIAQAFVLALFFSSDLGYLWYNVIGAGVVVVVAMALQAMSRGRARPTPV